MLSKLLRYHTIWECKRLLVACSVLRGVSLSSFEIFDVARGQGKALSFPIFLKCFQKTMWFYLLTTKDSLMGTV